MRVLGEGLGFRVRVRIEVLDPGAGPGFRVSGVGFVM
jgi:hypothetical protein